ncbi:FecR domain-containing protein [Geobacter sp. SVR]|uniref:FecR domain-containing protein n=1 Tax=Geobacter sp. SVR TaxID=2495594 RepID=UPI00143EF975|nr:FecR domain-containing protein [Geobacter sp. SVR]BCS52870.1 hypothetical protein GSVR_11780 [Geobacter sp. SVR]GCF87493.1 hypothetical protein GSbR_40930 [Geobacter sp. SVR]
MRVTLHRMISLICLLSSLVIPVLSAAAGNDRTVVIRVARQETLIGICRKYLEHPGEWRQVATINRLADPDRIAPGQSINLPVGMLKGVPLKGKVTLLTGAVARKSSTDAAWEELKAGDVVQAGSSLRTGAASTVEVTFEDGTSFLLRENSELFVRKAGKGALHLLRELYLESGKVISRIKAATGRDSRFEVETPSALAAARGTEYRVAVDETLTTRAETLEHSIDVSSSGTTVLLREGEGSIVRKNEPPSAPVRLLPPPEPENLAPLYDDRTGEIRFARVENAASYRIVLARDPEGKDTARTATIRPEEPLRFEGLADGTYYVIASSIGGEGLEGPLSQPRQTRVRKKPVPPTVVAPENGAALPEMPIRVQWHTVLGAASYQAQISGDPDFSTVAFDSGTTRETAYHLKQLQAGTHYLRVRSLAQDGYAGDWSTVHPFSIVRLMPPSVKKPQDGDDHFYLEWEPINGTAGYHLQISRDRDFRVVFMDRVLVQPRLMLVTPLEPGTYYVRVSGMDAGRNPGGFSQVGSFTVEERKHYWYEALGGIGAAGAALLLLLL